MLLLQTTRRFTAEIRRWFDAWEDLISSGLRIFQENDDSLRYQQSKPIWGGGKGCCAYQIRIRTTVLVDT